MITIIDLLKREFLGKSIEVKNDEDVTSGVVSSIYELGDKYTGYTIIFNFENGESCYVDSSDSFITFK